MARRPEVQGRARWEVEELRINLDQNFNRAEWRVENFQLDIELKADLTEEQRVELYEEAHNCFVHRSLKHVPDVNLDLKLV